MSGSINVARLQRENEALRRVAFAGARLRRLGLAVDQIEDGMQAVWRETPDMTRSATGMMMAASAYSTALATFDQALLDAADVFAKDPFGEEIALHPVALRSNPETPAS